MVDDELKQLALQMIHVSDQDLQNLIAYNASYLEVVESMIIKTDRALEENHDAQEEIHEKLADNNDDAKSYLVSVAIYMRPYFKDRYGMVRILVLLNIDL